MKIGILGSGNVGRDLGTGLRRHDHEVMIGSRNPESEVLVEWKRSTGGTTGSSADAAAFGDLVMVATSFDGTEAALRMAGPERLAGKIVVDLTNPLDFSTGAPRLSVSGNDSAGESVQRWLPDAHVVKALNSINSGSMIDPSFPGGPPTMCIAGNDEDSRLAVAELLESVGWDVADLGSIESARYIEGLAMCWIVLAGRLGGAKHAFKLLRTDG